MTFDREEYRNQVNGKRAETANRPHLEMLTQAQVRAELLTGDRHWDTFLSYLEAAKTRTKDQIEEFDRMLRSPQLVDPNEIMGVKMSLAQLEERVKMLDAVIELPSDIKRSGEQAKSILERLPE